MKKLVTLLDVLLKVCGLLALVLGIGFWTGHGLNLVPLHMMLGGLLVLVLWTMAGIGLRAGVPVGIAALVFVWGLVVPVLGVTQINLLPGVWHWAIQALHLAVGFGAVALGTLLRLRATRAGGRSA